MKKYAGDKKWTKGVSRVARVTDQSKFMNGLKETAKIVSSKIPWFLRGKRSWDK